MGNPSLPSGAFPDNTRVAPPIAPPAQPGEVRGCLRCERCIEVIPMRSTREGFIARCAWQGEWWWPTKGCDRWALRAVPLEAPE